jgi:hypothetical protein
MPSSKQDGAGRRDIVQSGHIRPATATPRGVTTTKDEQRRQRAREYDAHLAAARDPIAVLCRFAQAREASGDGAALEVGFAATPVGDGPGLPAAVWVALRQGDVDAVLDLLVEHATEQFVVAEHEQLDASYRLTKVAECRGLPDLDRLVGQLAAFVDVPRDVVAMVCGWGPDDERTAGEVDRLLAQRRAPADGSRTSGAALAMSSSEFAAVLSLTPEQQSVLATLVRQADITVTAGT